MATIVTQYDPWREKLAAGLGINLLSDALQRNQAADAQRKNNAVYAETLKSLGLMGGEQEQSPYDPLLSSQALPEGYNNNGWAKAMHDSYTPMTQFNLGTSGVTQPASTNKNLGQLDYITALAKTINSDPKRFGGVDFSNIYTSMLKPTMEADAADYAAKSAEQQRARQQDYANSLLGAKTPQERDLLLQYGMASGILGDNISDTLEKLYEHSNPFKTFSSLNTGGQSIIFSHDPLTGAVIPQFVANNTVSPDKGVEIGLGRDKLAWEQNKGAGELGIKQQTFMLERDKQAFEQLGEMEKVLNSQLAQLQEEVDALEDPAKKKEKILEIKNLRQQLANIQQQKVSLYQSGLMGMNNYTGQSQQGGGQEYTQVNSRVRGYSDLINKYAQEFGVDPDLITAIMQVESAGNPNAVSGEGARGLMQFMPDTAAQIARNLGIKEYDLHDPETSIKFGAALLKELQTRYKGNLEGILGDYNGGPKGANPKTRVLETQNYIPKVLSILNALKAERQAAQQQQVQQIVPLPNVQQTQQGAVAPVLNTGQPEKEPTTTSEKNVNQKPTELVEIPVMTIGGVTYSRMEDPNERKRYTKLYNPKTREEISWEQLEDAVNSDKYGGDIEKLKADLAEEGFVDINKNPINMGFSYQNPTVNNGTPKTIWPGGVAPYSPTDPLSVDAMSSAQPPAPAGNIPNTPNIDANEAYGNIPFFDTPNPLFETGHIPYQVHASTQYERPSEREGNTQLYVTDAIDKAIQKAGNLVGELSGNTPPDLGNTIPNPLANNLPIRPSTDIIKQNSDVFTATQPDDNTPYMDKINQRWRVNGLDPRFRNQVRDKGEDPLKSVIGAYFNSDNWELPFHFSDFLPNSVPEKDPLTENSIPLFGNRPDDILRRHYLETGGEETLLDKLNGMGTAPDGGRWVTLNGERVYEPERSYINSFWPRYGIYTDNFMTSDMPKYNGDDPLMINPDVQTWLNRTSKTYTQPPLPIELSKYLTLPYWINGKKAIDGFHSRFRRR